MVQSGRIERVLSVGNIFWSANETLNQMLYQATHWGFIDISAAIYYVPRNLIYRLMHEFYAITGYPLSINMGLDDHKRTIFQIFLKELECTLITIQDIDPTSEQFIIPCSIDEDREEKIKQVIIALTKHRSYLDCTKQGMSKIPLIQRIINFFKRRF
jgi:hypothetical protein